MNISAEELIDYYRHEGLELVKLDGRTRKPFEKGWPEKTVSAEDMKEHLRCGGGVGWKCGERSDWMSAVDADWPEARALAHKFLPETLQAAKGNEDPSHYFYRSPGLGFEMFEACGGLGRIIDLKASNDGAGHQVVVEPTNHPNKGLYRFVGGYNPAAIDEVPAEELRQRVGLLAVTALIARVLPTSREEGGGGRHDFALSLFGYLLRNGESLEDAEKIALEAWEYRKAPREAIRDLQNSLRDTADRLEKDRPATGGRKLEELVPGLPATIAKFLQWRNADHREQRRHYSPSDLGNAERIIDRHRDRIRWCPAWKSWLVWSGKRWARDERGEVVKLAHETARSIYEDAANEPDEEKQKQIVRFALASQNESRINAMLNQAKPYLAVGMEDLDTDRWLLNCQNGTLDLRTGRLREHDPADLITRIVPVEYSPEAAAPRFEKFLQEALVDDEVISFVKRYSGYTATGITRERLFTILHGSGKNGKSTLIELLQDVLGDYSTSTDVETLLIKKHQTVGNDVAALRGARFVAASEIEQNRRLAESKVKQLTGRDTVTARFLFGEFFDFVPEFKLWLSTNHKPVIQGTDDAIWDRIRLVPFNRRFDGPEAQTDLAEKLREEMPGVLAWMVAGCLEWQEHGLQEPEAVTDATRRYREEMDTLAAFLEDRCVVHKKAIAPATPLYKQYRLWCDDAGEKPETQKTFGMRLRDRGFDNGQATSGPNKGRKVWFGVGIKVDDPGPDGPLTENKQDYNALGHSDDGLPGRQEVDDGLPEKNSLLAGRKRNGADTVDDGRPRIHKVPHEIPHVRDDSGKRSTSSTSSTARKFGGEI